MYTILTDFSLKKKIKIEKIGLNFRNLKISEKNKINNDLDEIYTKHKKLINNLTKKYDKNQDLYVNLLLSQQYEGKIKESILFCWMLKKSGFKFNSKKQVEKILNNIMVIEYDKDVLLEYIEENNITKIISKILTFYDVFSSDIDFNKKVRIDYTYILNEGDILNSKLYDYNLNLLINILSHKDNVMTKSVELSEEYLILLKKFIDKLSKDEIRKFLLSIDLLYSKYTMIQNQIINNVMIIEGILINSENSIKQNFTLKTGIILNHYLNTKSNKANSEIKELLDYTYDIRSSIVHGNESNILNLLTNINKKNIFKNKLVDKNTQSYNDRKKIGLAIARDMSLITTRAIMKYWLEYPNKIDYMKNN